ncbi:hypothetical protein TNCT6_14170 [Streptomyces sp. 6-11-2]|nr:hypothetical protein TNCT6_14170 [Streptomyces sp. 6-11-2]
MPWRTPHGRAEGQDPDELPDQTACDETAARSETVADPSAVPHAERIVFGAVRAHRETRVNWA